MPWIESHTDLGRHPKLLKLSRALGITRRDAMGLVHMLWHWCLDYAPDGVIGGHDPASIADAVDWQRDPNDLLKGLESARFITDGKIHDWDSYAGRYIRYCEYKREKQREYRERKRYQPVVGNVPSTLPERSAAFPASSRVQYSTVQYRTEHNQDTFSPSTKGVVRGSEAAKSVETDGSKEPENAIEPEKKALTVAQKPPTREEMDLHAAKIGLPAIEVDKFVNHYASKGWKVGKEPMKSWHAAMAGWKCRWQERNGAHFQPDHSKGF